MPRPTKDGLDYFPLDVDIDNDEKMELVEAKHGLLGFAVIIRILMRIYRNGYCYPWTEKEQLLFSRRIGVELEQVREIINDAAKFEFFDQALLDKYQVLSSKGIQKRYLEAVGRRHRAEVRKEYLLICKAGLKDYKNLVIVDINAVNDDINPVKDDINPQSKVKESKEKKKGKTGGPKKTPSTAKDPDHDPADTEAALNHYINKFKRSFNVEPDISFAKDKKILKDLVKKHGLSKVKRVIDLFMADTDRFVQENGYSIGTMKSKVNKYLIDVNKMPVQYGPDWIRKKDQEEREKLKREMEKEETGSASS